MARDKRTVPEVNTVYVLLHKGEEILRTPNMDDIVIAKATLCDLARVSPEEMQVRVLGENRE